MNTEYYTSWHWEQLGLFSLHGCGVRGKGVRIAVWDTGVQADHRDLPGVVKGGWNFITNSADASPVTCVGGVWAWDAGHGTACAGLIGAQGRRGRPIGGAPAATIVPVKTRRSLSPFDAQRALEWISENADLLLCPWVMRRNSEIQTLLTQIASPSSNRRGLVLVAPVGNRIGPVGFPACLPCVLGVGASDENGRSIRGTSSGSGLDLLAPGGATDGTGLDTLALEQLVPGGLRLGRDSHSFRGTSAAAAVTAAAAALLLSEQPDLSATEVRHRLVSSARVGIDGPCLDVQRALD